MGRVRQHLPHLFSDSTKLLDYRVFGVSFETSPLNPQSTVVGITDAGTRIPEVLSPHSFACEYEKKKRRASVTTSRRKRFNECSLLVDATLSLTFRGVN